MKKILLIIGILAIVGVAAFLILGSGEQAGEGGSTTGFSLRDYLPFGKSEDIDLGDTTPGTDDAEIIRTEEGTEVVKPVPRLRKISSEPVAGAAIFNVGTTSLARFVEKGTGNVYEAKSDTVNISRLTNTTIPKIIRAFWLPNGSGFLAQTLTEESEIVETSFVKLSKVTLGTQTESLTPFNTTISKLPTGIKEISVKPDSTKIFYYTASGSSSWFVSNPDGTASTPIFSHPLTEWIPRWISGNTVIMQTKGSSGATGYTYSFNVSTKALSKIGIGAVGLSANTNPDGSLSLISSGTRVPQLFIVNNKTASASIISANTLAEKCVWLKDKSVAVICAIPSQIQSGNYPDSWYKGMVSTEDSIRKIEAVNDIFYNISNLSLESGQKIDVADLMISPDESHLIFRNKIDGYLWMLRIEE